MRARRIGRCAPTTSRAWTHPGGGPSSTRTAAAGMAFGHFWHNNVRGDLQGEYDKMWGLVAQALPHEPWVLGYDPFNEPFSTSLVRFGDAHFDAQLECFYTGTGPHRERPPRRAAPAVPDRGPGRRRRPDHPGQRQQAPDLRRAGQLRQPRLPDLSRAHGPPQPRLQHPRLLRGPQPGHREPDQRRRLRGPRGALARRAGSRPPRYGVAGRSPAGPAWFVSEFGASSDPLLLASSPRRWTHEQVGWAYWAWKYYADPTGAPTSRWSWRTGACVRPRSCSARSIRRQSPARRSRSATHR